MEIRNYQQSYNPQFGAFKLPKEKLTQDAFANLVSNYGEKPYNIVERSLTSLIEKHAKDKHFDFMYNGEKFVIEPKTSMALKMFTSGIDLTSRPLNGTWEKFLKKYGNHDQVIGQLKGFNKFKYELQYVGALLKHSLTVMFRPFDTLPVELRQASKDVSELEKIVEKEASKFRR